MNSHPLSLTHPYVALTLTTAALQVVGTRELSTRGESKQVWESYRRRLVVGKGKWESVAWAWRIPSSTSPGSHERGWVGLEYNVQYAVVRDTTPTTNDGFPVSFLFQWRALHAAEQTSWWCFFLGWRFLIIPSPIEFSFQEQLKAVAIWGHRLALFHWIAYENDWRWWKTQRPVDEQSTESALSKRALFASDLELRQQMLLIVEIRPPSKLIRILVL